MSDNIIDHVAIDRVINDGAPPTILTPAEKKEAARVAARAGWTHHQLRSRLSMNGPAASRALQDAQ